MNIEDLIPSRVFLAPLSRSLSVADVEAIDEEGNLIAKADRGYSWVVSDKDPSKCNPEFISLDKLWHKPTEVPKPFRKGMLAVGCLIRYKSGAFEYGEYWFGDGFNKWVDPVAASLDIDINLIHSWCYIKDLLPKGGE